MRDEVNRENVESSWKSYGNRAPDFRVGDFIVLTYDDWAKFGIFQIIGQHPITRNFFVNNGTGKVIIWGETTLMVAASTMRPATLLASKRPSMTSAIEITGMSGLERR